MAKALGIDVGTWEIRAALGDRNNSALEEVQYRRLPVEWEGEGPPSLEARLETLSRLLSSLELPDLREEALAWPASQTSLKSLTLPFTDRSQLEQVLPFEVEELLPYSMEDYVLVHRVLGSSQEGSEVLCALAPQDGLQRLLEGVQSVGVDPRHLALDAEALTLHAPNSGDHLLLHVGWEGSMLVRCREGRLLTARALSAGLQSVAEQIRERRECSLEEARSLLLSQWAEAGGVSIQAQASTTSAEVDPQWLAERVQEGLQPLLSSLRLSLYAMSSEQPPESLVVTGEARKIPGFAKSLSELTDLKTQSASLSVPAGMEICHALALRAAGRRARDLDFRTGSLAYKGDLARYRMLFTYGSLGIVGLAMAGMLLFGLRYQQLRAEIQQMELTIQETTTELFPEVGASVASTPMQARAAAAEQAMNTTLRLEAFQSTLGGDPPTVQLLSELSKAVPSNTEAKLEVKELTLNTRSLRFRADTTGYEAAAAIEASLKKNERFAAVTKGEEKKKGDELSFTITIPFEEEEEESP